MNAEGSLGLGLIGCGSFGGFCMETYAEMPGLHAAAVADVIPEAARAFGERFGVPRYADPADLIADASVHLVHIATPPSTHYELALAAARAGKHVLCEKPLALSRAQADAILQAVRSAGVLCPVNFVLRYNAAVELVKAVLDSGTLGSVLSARLTNCAGDTGLGDDHWFWNKDLSGGIFVEHGVHFYDLYAHWLGPGRVASAWAETRPGGGQEDRVGCTVRHDSGAIASHYHGFDQVSVMDRTDHRLVCELGDIHVAGWIPLTVTIDAAVSDEAAEKLESLCTGAMTEILEDLGELETRGRGKPRRLSRRIRLTCTPAPDKQTVYADSVRQLMADQLVAIADPSHPRRVTENNGREAVAMAEDAVQLAAE